MYRTHHCGELRMSHVNTVTTLAGWVQRIRKMGAMTFVDLRDRYGITQLVFSDEHNAELCEQANKLGREYVIQVTGVVNERYAKNFSLGVDRQNEVASRSIRDSNFFIIKF